jgi:serine/threonine-protein kinase
MGEVYRARDSRLEREVAIKVLPDAVARDPKVLARFGREARAVAALSHPNILAIHDVGTEGPISFAVMELLEGESLADRLARTRLPWRKAVEIGVAISDGLAAAHSKGIVHRDLKPANVFLTADGSVKILDFGIAHIEPPRSDSETSQETETGATAPGTVAGTVGYMSPEQVRGLPTDARSDIFSFGCVLYEMLSGRRAFARDTSAETLTAILREEPQPLSVPSEAIPYEVEHIVSHCVEKSADERFQSARDLAFHLRATLASPTGARAVPAAPPARRWRRSTVWGAGTVLVAAVIAAVLFWERRGALPSAAASAAGGGSPVRSVAVLPLENLSHDPEQEYFADGMTEALITDLAKIKALKVISRTSVMQYKGVKKPLRAIAKELGVDGIIEGSVMRIGDRVRISAQLIEASTDRHLWAENYERDLRDVLALQGEVARAVAREVRVTVSPQEEKRLANVTPLDPAAHEAYLKGRFWRQKFTREGFEKAIGFYRRAVQVDPNYALAHAAIAEANLAVADLYLPSREAYEQAKQAVGLALALDPSLSEAHTSLGLIRAYLEWDSKAAEKEFQRAIDLNPGSAVAHDWYGWFLTLQGRFDDGVASAERAVSLDPLSPELVSDLALPLILKGDYARGEELLWKALEFAPGFWVPHLFRAYAFERQGNYAAAVRELEAATQLDAGPVVLAELGSAYGRAGRRRDAERMLAELDKVSKTRYVTPFFYAIVYAGLAEKDRAFELLRECVEQRSQSISYWVKVGPMLDPLRSDPRYDRLLRDLNLAL